MLFISIFHIFLFSKIFFFILIINVNTFHLSNMCKKLKQLRFSSNCRFINWFFMQSVISLVKFPLTRNLFIIYSSKWGWYWTFRQRKRRKLDNQKRSPFQWTGWTKVRKLKTICSAWCKKAAHLSNSQFTR